MGTTFCSPNCCRIEEGNEGFKLRKSQTKGERSSCTNITNTQGNVSIHHHNHLPLRTHIHTTHALVCLATIFRTRGTQFETLYGNHISNATNISIYHIYLYDNTTTTTTTGNDCFVSFVFIKRLNHCHGS